MQHPGCTMQCLLNRAAALVCFLALFGGAATLEKLSVEEMSQKATLIVRGRVTGCAGESQGSVIYTRCRVAVSERWKGTATARDVTFVVPGGTARGLIQTFIGTPRFENGQEFVLFLWAGRSGVNQVIGLTQGVFDLKTDVKGKQIVRREASTEVMLDKGGAPVQDSRVELTAAALKAQVAQALAKGNSK